MTAYHSRRISASWSEKLRRNRCGVCRLVATEACPAVAPMVPEFMPAYPARDRGLKLDINQPEEEAQLCGNFLGAGAGETAKRPIIWLAWMSVGAATELVWDRTSPRCPIARPWRQSIMRLQWRVPHQAKTDCARRACGLTDQWPCAWREPCGGSMSSMSKMTRRVFALMSSVLRRRNLTDFTALCIPSAGPRPFSRLLHVGVRRNCSVRAIWVWKAPTTGPRWSWAFGVTSRRIDKVIHSRSCDGPGARRADPRDRAARQALIEVRCLPILRRAVDAGAADR